MGTKKLRLASLPPYVKENDIRVCMSRYGEVKRIRDDGWTYAYRYKVYNGIRIVEMKLKQHLPSHMSIAGNDAIISYDGQPPTCYRCNEKGHQQLECPGIKRLGLNNSTRPTQTWTDIESNKTQEQLPNTSVLQKSPIHEIGTNRIGTLPGVKYGNNRPPLPQRTQAAPDGMNMESNNVVNIKMGHKYSDTDNDDVKMHVPDEQENRGGTISIEGRKSSILSSDNEREMLGNSQLVDEDDIISETHAEVLRTEKHRL